jgi:hypothetical protein
VIDRHIANGFTSCLIGSLLAVASLPTSADPVTVRSTLVASDSTSTLAQLRSSGDLDLQRRHAWKVLNELASTSVGNESTAFESWYGEGAVFSASGDPNTRGIGGFARSSGDNGVVTAHDRFAFQGVPVLSYTLYNDAAYTHIRANQLYKVAQLDRLRISGRQDEEITVDRAIPEFPAQAVVLKTAWWPVAAQRVTALPIWDPAENPNRRAGPRSTLRDKFIGAFPALVWSHSFMSKWMPNSQSNYRKIRKHVRPAPSPLVGRFGQEIY